MAGGRWFTIQRSRELLPRQSWSCCRGTTPLVNELLPKVLKVSSDPKNQEHEEKTK